MDKNNFMVMSHEKVEEIRGALREFDHMRYGAMMQFWASINTSPQKAGYTAAIISVVSFILGVVVRGWFK